MIRDGGMPDIDGGNVWRRRSDDKLHRSQNCASASTPGDTWTATLTADGEGGSTLMVGDAGECDSSVYIADADDMPGRGDDPGYGTHDPDDGGHGILTSADRWASLRRTRRRGRSPMKMVRLSSWIIQTTIGSLVGRLAADDERAEDGTEDDYDRQHVNHRNRLSGLPNDGLCVKLQRRVALDVP